MLPAPWTFSALEGFESCPRRYFHTRVAKDIKDPPNEASIWGNRVHKTFEARINTGVPLDAEYKHWEPIAKKIESLPGTKYPEFKLAVDDAYKKATWGASWGRGIADLIVINDDKAVVIDYKTGKRKPSDQLQLYAVMTLATFPQVRQVETGFVWLKDKKVDKDVVTQNSTSSIWLSFRNRVARLEDAHDKNKWPERPNGLCKNYCPVKQCQFNGK